MFACFIFDKNLQMLVKAFGDFSDNTINRDPEDPLYSRHWIKKAWDLGVIVVNIIQ